MSPINHMWRCLIFCKAIKGWTNLPSSDKYSLFTGGEKTVKLTHSQTAPYNNRFFRDKR